jgi:O-methyltransferase
MKRLVFGCGDWCARYLESMGWETNGIVGFLDNDKSLQGAKLYGIASVFSPERLPSLEYDEIIVCSNSTDLVRRQILAQLSERGARQSAIHFYPQARKGNGNLPRLLLFKNLARHFNENNIDGDIAECGVWRGQTAAYLNRYFFDRNLHLFDTFEGYPESDFQAEAELDDKFNREIYVKIDETSTLEPALSKLTFPDNVSIHKGYFPESAKDVDGKFAFVHVDFGLYNSELAVLEFFYDRLTMGGAMLFGTYFSTFISGTRKAVADFEKARGIKLIKTPIADATGCLIVKS